MQKELRVGVVGYSTKTFDIQIAKNLLREVFDKLHKEYDNYDKIIVSGLTDLGIPSLAYQEAYKRGWKTVGIACSRAIEYKCFPVDEKIIVGEEWGEESLTFLASIDVIVRIGGGEQSQKEVALAKEKGKQIIEYELDVKD